MALLLAFAPTPAWCDGNLEVVVACVPRIGPWFPMLEGVERTLLENYCVDFV